MRYTLLLHSSPADADFEDPTPEQVAEQKAIYGQYIGSLQAAGVFVDTDWLQPADTAKTLTLKDGDRHVQDGAFAETKEQLGGYFVIEVPDIDAAMAWAEKCPAVQYGYVEVRASAMGGG